MSGFVNGKVLKDASVNIKNKLDRVHHTTDGNDGKDVVNVEFLKEREESLYFDDSNLPTINVYNGDNVLIDSFQSGGDTGWTPVDATETVKGIIKTSTQQDVIDGIKDDVAVTPKDLLSAGFVKVTDIKDASTTQKGIIEIAETSEVIAGTSTTLAVSPASLEEAGYVRDVNYVHTDNNLTDDLASKLNEIEILKAPSGDIVKRKIIPFTKNELLTNNYILNHNLNIKRYINQTVSFPQSSYTVGESVTYTLDESGQFSNIGGSEYPYVIDGNNIKFPGYVGSSLVDESEEVYYIVEYIEDNNPALINSLECGNATALTPILEGVSTNGNTLTVPYSGGNGRVYSGQSNTINGITFTLPSGTLANGSGNLVYNLSGTPNSVGYVNIPILFGGKTCTVTLTVSTNVGSIGALDLDTAMLSDTLTKGQSINGITLTVPYTGGNGGTYPQQVIVIDGITFTLPSGTLANGSGNLVYNLSGIPTNAGLSFGVQVGVGSVTDTFYFPVADVQPVVTLNCSDLAFNSGSGGADHTILDVGVNASHYEMMIAFTATESKLIDITAQSVNGISMPSTQYTTSVGQNSIGIQISGTPINEGTFYMPVTVDGQTCNVPMVVKPVRAKINGTNPSDNTSVQSTQLDTLDFNTDKPIVLSSDNTKTVKIYKVGNGVIRTYNPSDFTVFLDNTIISNEQLTTIPLTPGDYYITIDNGFLLDAVAGTEVFGFNDTTTFNFTVEAVQSLCNLSFNSSTYIGNNTQRIQISINGTPTSNGVRFSYSTDAVNWTVGGTLLADPSTGFLYTNTIELNINNVPNGATIHFKADNLSGCHITSTTVWQGSLSNQDYFNGVVVAYDSSISNPTDGGGQVSDSICFTGSSATHNALLKVAPAPGVQIYLNDGITPATPANLSSWASGSLGCHYSQNGIGWIRFVNAVNGEEIWVVDSQTGKIQYLSNTYSCS